MRVWLTPEEMRFIEMVARERDELKTSKVGRNNWMVSHLDPVQLRIMGVAGEYAAAKGLGCVFNPVNSIDGDGDRGDLRCGDLSISLKTRNPPHLPDYIVPINAKHQDFLDDFGVVGVFTTRSYMCLELRGWFNAQDWQEKRQVIEVGGTREGFKKTRWAITSSDLRPMHQLSYYLTTQYDPEVDRAQEEGYLAYYRGRYQMAKEVLRDISV